MEEALVAWLLATAPLALLVGTRINWQDRPTAALPAITAGVADQATEYNHGGRDDLQYPRIQFDVWGASYSSAKKAARELAKTLELGADRPTAIFFDAIEINNSDMPTETLTGGTRVYRIMLEYYVPFKMKEA